MSQDPMPDAGRFIVLEGSDGVGKTTQADLLSAWMRELGVDHVVAREPGGTLVGEAIREVVLDRPDLPMPPETELLLILAARAAFVREVVEPALREGKVVLADRFSLSTLAYQGHARGLPLADVRDGIRVATGGLAPDLYVVLDLSDAERSERHAATGRAPDRIEGEGDAFLGAVRAGYLALAASEPGVVVLDGSGSPETVQTALRALLTESFPETFARS